jgi:hypothetical protein
MRGRAYQNAALTAIAVLLGISVVDRHWAITEPAAAQAQGVQPDAGGMSNALEQRKQMIAELRQMNSKLDRLEARLNRELNVKVTDMPPVRLSEPRGGQ